MLTSKQRLLTCVLGLLFAVLASPAYSQGPLLVPTSQDRSISAAVVLPSPLSDSSSAPDLGPWTDNVNVSLGGSYSIASQVSSIGDDAINGRISVSTVAHNGGSGYAVAICSFTFTVPVACRFSFHSVPQAFNVRSIGLVTLSDEQGIVFFRNMTWGSGTPDIASGGLNPGSYTFVVHSEVGAVSPPYSVSTSTYEFALNLFSSDRLITPVYQSRGVSALAQAGGDSQNRSEHAEDFADWTASVQADASDPDMFCGNAHGAASQTFMIGSVSLDSDLNLVATTQGNCARVDVQVSDLITFSTAHACRFFFEQTSASGGSGVSTVASLGRGVTYAFVDNLRNSPPYYTASGVLSADTYDFRFSARYTTQSPPDRNRSYSFSYQLRLTEVVDWNADGQVNSADFFAFLQDFIGGNAADYNNDGITDTRDFFGFLSDFLDR